MSTILRNGVRLPLPAGFALPTVQLPEPRHEVDKLVVVDRLEAAGLGEIADAALTGKARRRWNAAVSLYADDPEIIGFLEAIGADPVAILAPEPAP